MKFGHISEDEQEILDFHLPADHPDTTHLLNGIEIKKTVNLYCGCAKWGRKEWEGMLYPEKLKEKDYLKEYVKHFNAIELNSTFYNIKKNNIISWSEQAPEGFKFCPKISRRISHIKRLKIEDDFLDFFVNTTSLMGDNLGMAFLQLPENFGPKWLERMEEFFKLIPKDYPLAIELRSEDWFNDSNIYNETFELFKQYNKCAVITDVGGRRDILHMRLTTPVAFIRFVGYGINNITYQRLDEWVERLKKWIDMGLREIYFFPHQEDETFTPVSCHYFIKKMNEKCNLNIHLPNLKGYIS